jgi:DNA-binding XRE family transcriptional regulator
MYIFYDVKTDYLEILEKKVANYSEVLKKGIFEIKSEHSNKTIGYGIEDASKRIHKIDFLSPFMVLSVLIKMARLKRGYTQAQMAKKLKIGLLPYQRLESGTNNPTLKTILMVKEVFPEIELDKVA